MPLDPEYMSAMATANQLGRLAGLTTKQRLLIGLGGAAALFLFLNRRQVMTQAGVAFDFAKRGAFKVALPNGVSTYSDQILNAAQKYNVDPWVLAGIMYNESRGGLAIGYKPQGPAGTGDFIPRGPSSIYAKFANPATGLPPDGEGWGRGLMQVDYGAHNAWVISNNWRDAQTNINKGAEIFRWNLDYFNKPSSGIIEVEKWRVETGKPEYNIQPWKVKYPRANWPTLVKDPRPLSGSQLYEAALAAYNVSPKAVLQAIGLGLPAEAGTTRQEYVTKFLAVIAPWQAKFI